MGSPLPWKGVPPKAVGVVLASGIHNQNRKEDLMKAKRNNKTIKITVNILMTIFLILSFIRWEDSNFIFHAIVGTACALFFIIHVCIHFKWIRAVTKSFFEGRINKALKGKYLINMLLLAVWGIAITTGFFAVGYFSFEIESMIGFSRLHAITSRIGLVLVIVHIFQHIPQIKSYIGLKKKPQAANAR